ncbi:MAG: hypothetical protein GX200_08540 [Firmicutes bacterium]|nr:hypothetical protein [Bacillota bacterium]
MAKKYVLIEEPKPAPQDEMLKGILRRVAWLDDNVIKGAPYFDAAWIVKEIPKRPRINLHRHDFDEFLGFMGADPENHMDLGCEVEVQVDDDIMILRKTCLIFIPAGVKHGIGAVTNLTRPVLCYSGGPNAAYIAIKEENA